MADTSNPIGNLATALDSNAGNVLGKQSTLSEWAGPYVTDMLGKTAALSETPYQTYQGPLTAGTSALQQQAFQGIGSLAPSQGLGAAQDIASNVATAAGGLGYSPTQFQNMFQAPGAYQAGTFQGGTFDAGQAQQYMNPYMQAALAPTLSELNRQAEIARTQQAGRLSQAGAYGGSRQAIMESELARNLMESQRKTIGEGYASAYDKAMAQYNADQARALQAQQFGEQSRQFGAGQAMTAAQQAAQYGQAAQQATEASKQFGAQYGLSGLAQQLQAAQALGSLGSTYSADQRANLAQMLGAGEQQRAIEQQGIAADLAEFQTQRDWPYKQLQFQQSMLQGMPIQSVATSYQQPSSISDLLNTTGGLMSLYKNLFGTTS